MSGKTFLGEHEKDMISVTELFNKLESFAGHAVYRHIQVNIKDGKKYPIGEKNNMSVEQIKNNRGDIEANTLSLSVKHVPDLYVIDFDTKDLEDNELKQFLDKRNNLFFQTRKGFHYYVFIKNIIPYTNQQKVYKDETDIDLIKTNNIWESKSRKAMGNFNNIISYEWSELVKFFDEKKMNKSKKLEKKIVDFTPDNSDEEKIEVVDVDLEKIKTALKFLDVKRTNNYTDWVNVGLALYNQGNDNGGKNCEMWNDFSKRGDKYDGIMTIFKKYQSFSPKQDGLTIKSIFHWLKEDNLEEYNKLFPRAENKYHEWFMKGTSEFMKQMNEELCYYPNGGIYFYKPEPDWLVMNKKHHARDWFESFEFKIADKNKEGKFITINPFDFWSKNIERRFIRGVVMKPNQIVGNDYYNLWNGYKYKYSGKCNLEKVQYFIDHIKDVWANGDEEIGEYLLNWLAQIIQYPERKTQVCVVLKSIEGVGKTIILDMIGKIMGKEYYQSITKMGEALGRFNKILERKILVNFNETNWGGDKKMAGSFKSIITDNTINIEAKGMEPYTTDNLINCIITTNEEWVVQVSNNDRRFFMVECKDQKLVNSGIDKLLNTDLQELANFLYSRDISNFNPRNFKFTEMKEEQIIRNFDSVESFFFSVKEGDISISHMTLDDEDKFTIVKEHLYDYYIQNTTGKHNDPVTRILFWKKVRKIFPEATFKKAQKNKKPRIQFSSYDYLVETMNKYSSSRS